MSGTIPQGVSLQRFRANFAAHALVCNDNHFHKEDIVSTAPWGKTELRNAIVERSGIPAGMVDGVLNALASVVVEQVSQGVKLQVPGIVTIDVVQRSARTGRNPQTGETMQIPARRAVKVTPSAPLKRAAAGA